jgi:hypothetical protein
MSAFLTLFGVETFKRISRSLPKGCPPFFSIPQSSLSNAIWFHSPIFLPFHPDITVPFAPISNVYRAIQLSASFSPNISPSIPPGCSQHCPKLIQTNLPIDSTQFLSLKKRDWTKKSKI